MHQIVELYVAPRCLSGHPAGSENERYANRETALIFPIVLRQNLSVYLERVAAGTVFRVTDRGREVALLVPLPGHATTAQRLVASGRATPAANDLVSLGRPVGRTKRSVSEALREVRRDRL